MIELLKKVIKLSPIPLTKNHLYDILTKKIIKRMSNTSNCIDVGCYKGEILDLMINAAPKGQHFGVEPIPILYDKLNMKYNKLTNCTLLNYAASNLVGKTTFNYVISNPAYSGLKRRDYDRPNEKDKTIMVKTELLDNLIPKNLKIDLIKIDVEGAELLVLEGATQIISKYKPIVIFEHGLGAANHYNSSPEKLFSYFEKKSMKISNLQSYLRRKENLTEKEFKSQYYNKNNYYFVAHV